MAPETTGADTDGGTRCDTAHTAFADEGIMERDGIHAPRPDEERVRRARIAEVAVAAAFDDETEPMLAGEVHGGGDVRCVLGGDGIGARFRRPGVRPAERLRQRGVIADEVGIPEILEELRAGWIGRLADAGIER